MADSGDVAFDRTSLQGCEAVLVDMLPNSAVRADCLGLLLDGINAAHSLSRAAWSVTLFSNGIRLNVGSVEAFTLLDGRVRLLLEPGGGLDLALSPFLSQTRYRSVPRETQLLEVPASELARLLQHARGPFLSFVRGASVTKRGKPRRTPYHPSFSPGVVSYLSVFLGTPVPTPQFVSARANAGA
jgi:hypothetical protein